jgi:hypothetical protein
VPEDATVCNSRSPIAPVDGGEAQRSDSKVGAGATTDDDDDNDDDDDKDDDDVDDNNADDGGNDDDKDDAGAFATIGPLLARVRLSLIAADVDGDAAF